MADLATHPHTQITAEQDIAFTRKTLVVDLNSNTTELLMKPQEAATLDVIADQWPSGTMDKAQE